MGIHLPAARSLRAGLVAALTTTVLVVPAGPADAAACVVVVPGLPPLCPQPAATTPPTIAGTAKVGEVVAATEPVWDQDGVTTTYQWLRDGADIADATAQTYTLTSDDFGTMISVRASGQGSGLLPGTSDSAAVEPALGDPITATTAPVLTGSGAVGEAVTTSDGEWGEPAPSYTYQWYRSRFSGRGAEKIEGTTTSTYTPVTADTGRALVAVVVADRYGYGKGAAVSDVVRVPKTSSTTGLSLVRSTVRRTQAPSVRVVLGSGAGLTPTGVVTIFDGTRRVRSFTVSAAADGIVTFQLARQGVGKHRLTARYAGDTAHRSSTSGVAVLTVTR
ncbi:Ig-like domain repeat protein [Nocardioides rubriscoriae]|uniref:Ig-like domain repeat protein n=1 Tax=Nocardioides rubriscoriae TaxID=642762 RepID=UPI0011DF0663|nr:Ig-like domain repeat protein [Nocardioides rubriscoriae]